MEGVCEIVLIDLNTTYVLAKFELAKCLGEKVVEKVGQGQRLCVNIVQFWRATHRQKEDGEGDCEICSDRSQPYLCFGQLEMLIDYSQNSKPVFSS